MKTLLKHRILFLLAFGVSKATVLFAPLLLSKSNVLSKTDYGTLEYALSFGLILASLLNLGVPNAYPYFKLRRKYTHIFEGFKIHFIYLFLISIFLGLVIWLFVPEQQYFLAVLVAFVFTNQATYSMFCKSDEQIIKAVFLDALFYTFLLASYAFIQFFGGESSIVSIGYFIAIYAAVYVLLTAYKIKYITTLNIKKHQKLIKYGKSVMVSSFLILLIANSGRILIDEFLQDKTLVADYGFYFRMASFVVILHQVLTLIYFKKIYTFKTEKLDNMFLVFMGLIIIGSGLTYLIIPHIGPYFFDMFESYERNQKLYLILCFQMISWIVLANNENVIYREKLATKMNVYFIVLVIIIFLLMFYFRSTLSLERIAFAIYLMIFLANSIQFYILHRYRKISLKKTFLLILGTFILSIPIILWL